jgi:alginate O-acetyltransferase complex protein AlgJ
MVNEVIGPEPAVLTVDLVGKDYNFAEQRFQVKLDPCARKKTITRTLPSGDMPPAEAVLRISYSSPTRVAISKIRILVENAKPRLALAYMFLAGLMLLAVLAMKNIASPALAAANKSELRCNRLQLFFVFIFLVLIAAPWFQAKFKLVKYAPLDENRNRLEKPRGGILAGLFVNGERYGKDYEKYFNDNFGLRDLYIKLKNQLDFSLFNRSDMVVVGGEGMMEYRNVLENQEILGERLSVQEWDRIKSHILQMDAYLRSRGITLILLPIQQKFSIYPELMPTGKIVRPEKTAFLCLIEWLDSQPQLHYIDARKILLAAKKKHPVFYKTDFHWNGIGAFSVAEDVVNRIAQISSRPRRWSHPLQYHEGDRFIGGLTRSLGVLYPPKEKVIVIDKNWEQTGGFLNARMPFLVHFQAAPGKAASLLPPTMVVGNSFTDNYFEENGFYENFSESYFLHNANLPNLRELLPPGLKFLVYQFIELEIGDYFPKPDYWPVFP